MLEEIDLSSLQVQINELHANLPEGRDDPFFPTGDAADLGACNCPLEADLRLGVIVVGKSKGILR